METPGQCLGVTVSGRQGSSDTETKIIVDQCALHTKVGINHAGFI